MKILMVQVSQTKSIIKTKSNPSCALPQPAIDKEY
jgi:hypothetical protein